MNAAKSVTDLYADNRADSRMICRRLDGTVYAVFSSKRWCELRKANKLDETLERERDSGVIIDLDAA